MSRRYASIQSLKNGKTIFIDGFSCKKIEGDIQEGDFYVAERNTGAKLLTAKAIDPRGWIVPFENAYMYDTHECVRVSVEL